MMALLLSLALFLSLGIVGLAILTVAGRLRNRLQALLLAPAVGLAAMLLVVFTLNRVGLPIGSFALISVPVALVVPLAVLWRMRPRLPWRQYAPLFAVFLVTLVAIGQPALVYGFEWVAYANDDTTFNESFATAVERIGGQRWLATRASAAAREEYAALDARRSDFRTLTLRHRARLQALYESPLDDDAKRRGKAELTAQLKSEFEQLKRERWAGFSGYDAWFARANNAAFAVQAAYNELVPDFERLFEREGRDLDRFYAEVKRLAALPKAERRATLARYP